jgi:hypothetical protein
MTEIDRLELRYRRLFQFDRLLWMIYSVTAIIPGYYLLATSHAAAFHGFGASVVLVTGWLGWFVNSRLLQGRVKRESAAYCVTAAFILSRLGIVCFGIHVIQSQQADWGVLGELFLSTPIVHLAFIGGIYRMMYHIAVHFFLKIQRIKIAGQIAPREFDH